MDPFLPQPTTRLRLRAGHRPAEHRSRTASTPVRRSLPPGTKLIDEFSYSYDRDDRITKLATLLDGTATYTYDKIDQLTSLTAAARCRMKTTPTTTRGTA